MTVYKGINRKSTDDKLVELIGQYLNNARLIGMGISAKAISQVVYDIANDDKITETERLNKIKKFCDVGINNDAKQEEILEDIKLVGNEMSKILTEAEQSEEKKSAFERIGSLLVGKK